MILRSGYVHFHTRFYRSTGQNRAGPKGPIRSLGTDPVWVLAHGLFI